MAKAKKIKIVSPNVHAVILHEGILQIVNEAEFRSRPDRLKRRIGKVGKVWFEGDKIFAELIIDDDAVFQKIKEFAKNTIGSLSYSLGSDH